MAPKKTPQFEYKNCIACGICVQACPVSCLGLTKSGLDNFKTLFPQMEEDTCIGCGICAKSCPMDDIIMIENTAAVPA